MMSFRERVGHQPEWDSDQDATPPIWHGRSSPSRSGGTPVDDLPSWAHSESVDVDPAEQSFARLPPPRSRRVPSGGSDRRSSTWPNLRDSLRGNTSAAPAGTRSRHRSNAFDSPAAGQPRVNAFPDADRDDVHLPWPLPDSAGYEPPAARAKDARYPVRRSSATRSRGRSTRAAQAHDRSTLQLPAALATLAAAQDRVVLAAIGGSAFSLVLMVATVSSRAAALPRWFAIHLNAAGHPDRWATASTIWRLPLMTAMLTLAILIGALVLARRDPFASRFLLVSAFLIHALAWIGLVRILW